MAIILTGILSLCLRVVIGAQENHSDVCILNEASENEPGVNPVLAKHETALLLLLGFGGFSVLLAFLYMTLRRHIFHDADNVDTAFDAGGQVSLGLTAVTVASQLTWPAEMLQTATIAVRLSHAHLYPHLARVGIDRALNSLTISFQKTIQAGIAGPLFFAAGISFSLLTFPMLSVKFKIRCPGAKTYLQMIYARFGKVAHVHYTILALLVNLMIISCLTVSSRATTQAFTKDASNEFVVFIMATLFGSYSLVGGLGSTFYMSYFNAVLLTLSIAVIVVKVFFSTSTEYLGLGDIRKMYDTLECLPGPATNYGESFLTFRSEYASLYAVIGIFAAAAIVFGDQASWQSRIAAKPSDGVWGFILATAIYFAIPSVIGTSSGLAYLVMSSQNGTHLLSQNEVDIGLITPIVALKIFGDSGAYLLLIMTTMALMATGSGEVIAISSIIVYDIYQIHINPFRKDLESGMCVMCGRTLRDLSEQSPNETSISVVNDAESTTVYCDCPSVHSCPTCCHADIQESNVDAKTLYASLLECPTHGALRKYQEQLLTYKSWCILWVTVALVPFGLLILTSGISLNWMLLYGTVHVTSCLPGVTLSIMWAGTTKPGIIFGGLLSLAASICVNLGLASTYPGGISNVDNYFKNTVELESVVSGIAASVGVGLLSIILISVFTSKGQAHGDLEWKKTRNIDNPLHPWADALQEDFPDLKPGQRPTNTQMIKNCRRATLSAYIGSGIGMVIFILVLPGTMAIFPVLTFTQFQGWVYSVIAWAFLMLVVVIVVAPVQEAVQVYRRYRLNKRAKQTHHPEPYVMQTFKTINS